MSNFLHLPSSTELSNERWIFLWERNEIPHDKSKGSHCFNLSTYGKNQTSPKTYLNVIFLENSFIEVLEVEREVHELKSK